MKHWFPRRDGDEPKREFTIVMVALPRKAVFALYVTVGAAMLMIAAQSILITFLARRLGLLP